MPYKTNEETVVLITGASKGIGLATVKRLLTEGYQVIATSRSAEKSQELLALAKIYKSLRIQKLDVTDSEEQIYAIIKSFGGIDVLINNAGFGIVGAAESLSQAQIKSLIDTNVLGTVKVTNAALLGMREQNSGLIITLSSIVGPLPDMRQCFYSGSKAMIEHFTAQLRNDLKDSGYNIKVANVHPGPVVTNFEASATVGERFTGRKNPYPRMFSDVENWRKLMREGQPVSETVDTILKVMRDKEPTFWNATEPRVSTNFKKTYCDETGEQWSQGPIFAAKL